MAVKWDDYFDDVTVADLVSISPDDLQAPAGDELESATLDDFLNTTDERKRAD